MIYRFKVWFEDDEDIIRWIDIKPSNTFEDFHMMIQESIGFDKKEPSSFYLSDDNWKKHLEITWVDMGLEDADNAEPKFIMKDHLLRDFINDPHQRFLYVTDFMEMWTLYVELQRITDEENGASYPKIFKQQGKAPKQRPAAGRFKIVDEEEFDEIASKMIAGRKGGSGLLAEAGGIEAEDTGVDDDLEDDDEDEEDNDEFGLNDFRDDSEI